jgi:outer membrane protein assembly factor BamB
MSRSPVSSRFRLRVFLAAAVLTVALPELPAAAPVMYRNSPSHRANYDAPPIRSLPRVKWKTELAGEVFSTPAVSDGVVYIGSNRNRFYALDLATGGVRWQVETLGGANSSPAVVDGMVYFGDASGRFHAVEARSGKEKWVHQVHGERLYGAFGYSWARLRQKYYVDYCDVFLSSPVVAGDTIYYASGNGAVFALDRATGVQKWSFVTNEVIHCAPALADGQLFVGGWDTFFYCLDAESGALRWKFKTGDDPENHNQVGIQSAPVIEGQTVYFGCRDSHVYALDTTTGELRWKRHHGGSWVIASPVIVDDLLCYTTSDSRQFLALDKSTGEVRYELPTRSWSFSSAAAAGAVVYFGTFAGDLNAFDTKSGKLLWTWQTDAAKRDVFHMLDESGNFAPNDTAFANWDPENLVTVLQKLYSAGGIVGSVVPHDEMLLVPTADGFLYALQK